MIQKIHKKKRKKIVVKREFSYFNFNNIQNLFVCIKFIKIRERTYN